MLLINTWEKTFSDYHERIIKELASDSDLTSKIIKIENILRILHSLAIKRYSSEYEEEAEKFIYGLKHGKVEGMSVSIIANDQTRSNRLKALVEWFALIAENEPSMVLDNNIKRVSFD